MIQYRVQQVKEGFDTKPYHNCLETVTLKSSFKVNKNKLSFFINFQTQTEDFLSASQLRSWTSASKSFVLLSCNKQRNSVDQNKISCVPLSSKI